MSSKKRQALNEIAQQMRLTPDEIARRQEFLEFTQSDIEMLRRIHGHIESLHVDDLFTDLFYRHLRAFPELRQFIPDEATVERLKVIQSQYLSA